MRRLWVVVALGLVACQSKTEQQPADAASAPTAEKGAAPAPGSPEAKIASAVSAAPAEIGANATIVDWDGNPKDKPVVLRQGTNEWTCFADIIATPEPDPVCADKTTSAWFDAYMAKQPPKIATIGVAYMLKGDAGTSETDPFATGPTPDNKWHKQGPHTMVFLPDPKQLDAMSTDHTTGAPYVMWKGTPYAHVMLPLGEAK
jgi:hypothetical protein